MTYHLYADDTQIYKSVDFNQISCLVDSTEKCIRELKLWMNSNKLKLNDDKTEIMLSGNTKTIKNFPDVQIDINSHTIRSKRSLKNLGVQLDYDMSMSSQISQLSKRIYFQLKTIGSVRNYLTKAAAKTLVTTLILFQLDYCNAILSGLPAEKLSKLQVLQNQAAKLITKQKKSVHVTPILKELHWLPVKERIKYKTAVFCFKCLNDTAPLYLKQFLELYNPTRALRSSTDKLIFRIQKQNYKT